MGILPVLLDGIRRTRLMSFLMTRSRIRVSLFSPPVDRVFPVDDQALPLWAATEVFSVLPLNVSPAIFTPVFAVPSSGGTFYPGSPSIRQDLPKLGNSLKICGGTVAPEHSEYVVLVEMLPRRHRDIRRVG